MTPHPDYGDILSRLTPLFAEAATWKGDAFRMVHPKFSSDSDLLNGKGGLIASGRWHAKSRFRCAYAADTYMTAVEEAVFASRRKNLPVRNALPRLLVCLHLHAHKVLDLTNGTVRQRAIIGRERILSERWWSENNAGREAWTQAIGRAASSLGFEAILAPSAANPTHGVNIVVFPENLGHSSHWKVLTPVSET